MSLSPARRIPARLQQWSGSPIEQSVARLYLRASATDRFKIYRTLARLLDADIDARSSLEFIYEIQTDGGRNKGDLVAVAVRAWIEDHREHGRLSEAISGWVPTQEVLLIEAGERSGQFKHALDVMIRLQEKASIIRGSIGSKLAYPCGAALALSAAILYLSHSFLPPILAIKGDTGAWTGSAALTVSFLTWAGNYLIPAVSALFAAIAIVFVSLPHLRGPVRVILDRLPPWSVHRFMTGTAFLTAVLVLMESGKGLADALALTKPSASPYLKVKVDHIQEQIHEGRDFGQALARSGDRFPDRELIKEIQLYDRIGRLDEGLLSIVESWMDQATIKTTMQIATISNVVLGCTFIVLGFLFNGIYDIINEIKGSL